MHPTAKYYVVPDPAMGLLIDPCFKEPAESDHDSLNTDEELDELVFDNTRVENCNNEALKHGLDMGITDTAIESQSEKLIYPNARITNATSMLLIMTLAVIHKLSREALKVLTLIDMHCLIPHALPL